MPRKKKHKFTDKNGQIYKSTNLPKFWGHKTLSIYCKLSCSSAKRYWEGFGRSKRKTEQALFESAEIAKQAGYSPCKVCNPK